MRGFKVFKSLKTKANSSSLVGIFLFCALELQVLCSKADVWVN